MVAPVRRGIAARPASARRRGAHARAGRTPIVSRWTSATCPAPATSVRARAPIRSSPTARHATTRTPALAGRRVRVGLVGSLCRRLLAQRWMSATRWVSATRRSGPARTRPRKMEVPARAGPASLASARPRAMAACPTAAERMADRLTVVATKTAVRPDRPQEDAGARWAARAADRSE